tara:strand:- start:25192 stop:26241 length:1050 start_codon:yes stop_codon:yes gene_type:complete
MEAITSSSDTLGTQIASFVYFVIILGIALGAIPMALMYAVLVKTEATNAFGPSLLMLLGGMLYCAIVGATRTPAASNAVPELLGSYVNWWLAPAGLSWWLPWPLGTINRTVHIGEIATEINAVEIEAADNVHVSTMYTPVIRVRWPLVYVRYGGGPEKALAGLFNRTMRWFVSAFKSTKLPAMRGLASEVMSGDVHVLTREKHGIDSPEGMDEIRFQASDDREGDPYKRLWTVKETAESMGFEIERVLVDDFTLPRSIVEAAERERVEEAQRRAEETEIQAVISLVKMMKGVGEGEDLKLEGVSDKDILNVIQAERGKASRYVVDGSGDSLAKAASIIVEALRARAGGG